MTAPVPRVLIVDDDAALRRLAGDVLAGQGYDLREAADGSAALALLRAQPVDVVVSDLRMPGLDGLALLAAARALPEPPVVILLTAYGTVPQAVEAMRLGAFDFVEKPLPSPATLRRVVARALASRSGPPPAPASAATPEADDVLDRLMVAGPAMDAAVKLLRAVAPRDTTVLVTGESGTGKEVVARALHALSRRRDGPFVAVNSAAIPEGLVESELFGHEKGAFTGAAAARAGVFESAAGGTVFLDEIGELPAPVQAKLLRVLQERTVTRLGAQRTSEVDFRLIAATNRDLGALVRQGRFREDLYFRVAVVPLALPPLRERTGDLEPLVRRFLRELEPRRNVEPTPAAWARLRAHPWPGNVRELRNAIERALVLAGDAPLDAAHLQLDASALAAPAASPGTTTLDDLERRAILEALDAVGGNRKAAAERLGISLRTLQYRLKEYKGRAKE
ncbi:MAG: sigma-54-dependent Fis family transcriptional regulator [Deltaproteobacteria bacterium]|nr:sigma-54-dependent Fis family transcriptional regulator [Deltaproteobacteria bacterium]